MKKINILFVSLLVFFIGVCKVNAEECKYTDGEINLTITINKKETKIDSNNTAIIKKSKNFDKNFKKCGKNIWGYSYYASPTAIYKTYILYATEFTTDELPEGAKKTTFSPIVEEEKSGEVNEEASSTNLYGTVSCGNETVGIKGIPARLVSLVNTIIKILYIAAPILLIILGMIDFGKGIMGQKEDEIMKGRKIFVKRLIAAVLVFLVVMIVKWGVRFVNESSENSGISSCIDCFISGKCN